MKIAVVGAGAMGRWAVKELGISPQVEEIVVGDFDEEQARGRGRQPRRRQGPRRASWMPATARA